MWSLFAASEKRGGMDLQGDDRIETNQDIAVDASNVGRGQAPERWPMNWGSWKCLI